MALNRCFSKADSSYSRSVTSGFGFLNCAAVSPSLMYTHSYQCVLDLSSDRLLTPVSPVGVHFTELSVKYRTGDRPLRFVILLGMTVLRHWRVSVFSPFCFYHAVFVTLGNMKGQVGNTIIAGLERDGYMYIVH